MYNSTSNIQSVTYYCMIKVVTVGQVELRWSNKTSCQAQQCRCCTVSHSQFHLS